MINHELLQDPFDFMIDHFLQPTKKWHEAFNESDLFQNLNEQYEETFMYDLTPIQQCDYFHNVPVDLHFSGTELNMKPIAPDVFDKNQLKQQIEDHQNAKIIFDAQDLKITIEIGGEKQEPAIDKKISIHLAQANKSKSLSPSKSTIEFQNQGIQANNTMILSEESQNSKSSNKIDNRQKIKRFSKQNDIEIEKIDTQILEQQIRQKFCQSFKLQTSIRILKNERLHNMLNI
ncbi:UNKNOWN [Stylonychia lemnae]|uniref:Uncharacterized protein n=1 Tax=Stylonychia lemnae TaxID=5949 RepID=A0A078ANQ0_STYLE|nr:UNKNOWN [Stylonychia lemnae]|eukprot:CDW83561.1 UNKNOWN [Stylonychia lemnae]